MRGEFRRWRRAVVLAVAGVLTMAGVAGANVALTQVSADPYTNPTSQHATELEPDTFAYGGTVVAAFQVGRFFNGGSTDIGFATSTHGALMPNCDAVPSGATDATASTSSSYQAGSTMTLLPDSSGQPPLPRLPAATTTTTSCRAA